MPYCFTVPLLQVVFLPQLNWQRFNWFCAQAILNPNVGLLDTSGVQCSGVVSPFSVLDSPVSGATTSYRTSTTLLTAALSSTSMPVMGYTLVEAICVAIGAETTWITRGGGLCASCTGTSFQVPKLLDITFEDTESIPWDKAKETLLRRATTFPPATTRICFLMEYKGFSLVWGAGMTDGFMLMYKGLRGLRVVVHSIL